MASPTRAVSFLEQFSALNDPRQAAKVLYPLDEVLLLVLCAVLSGADDFVEIAGWGGMRLDFLRRFRPFARGIPSHDTLNDIFNMLDPGQFQSCFMAWAAGLRAAAGAGEDPVGQDLIALDGKTSRRSGDRRKGRGPLHLVSAWASRQRLVLGQEAVAEASNEIVAIPALLEKLALQGALVTIDAIGCQHAIAEAIREAGGDYLLAVKSNQPALLDDLKLFFEDAYERDRLECFETTDGDHGRIEVRRHRVCNDVQWLRERHRWKDLNSIAMVEASREIDGKTTLSRRFYISSTQLDTKGVAAAVRSHWTIENQLHWTLDVVFHDDLSRLRSENGPQNMATIRHAALNLVKQAKDKASLKVRRKKAAWSVDYLEAILRGSA
jgi:predicted transposase YbfD/YdcC